MNLYVFRRPARMLRRFRANRRGNVAVIFALACLPLLAAVGCAVDYSGAVRTRSKMQSAADAASVGSVSAKSPGFLAAQAMTGDGSVAAGVTDATNIFNGNMSGQSGYSGLKLTPVVNKTGSSLTSSVTFSA
jgi:Flp pilus assembly protein TadG